MALEKFIRPHLPYKEAGEHGKNHVSKRSITRSLQEAQNKILEYRTERTVAHETGHRPPPSPDYLPDGLGTEIELFIGVETNVDANRT